MDRERWAQIKDVFAAVVEQPSAQRQFALGNICQGDPDLQAEVLDLLRYHQEASRFLTSPAAESTPTLLEPGELLAGRYRIQAFLGSGGMAEVYEAEDCELGGRVALKVIYPHLCTEKASLDRFRREVHLARQVTHPNVCRVFDIGHDHQRARDIVFLTMELIRGETLAARLKRIGRLSPLEALSIALQLCQGLGAAHDAGVLHRDFKPGNVLLFESQGQLRASITDFGIARALGATDAPNAETTASGAVLGTPAYMSPEQLAGKRLTLATDIYSLGLVLYEMITGVKPFGESVWINVLRRLTGDPAEPVQHVPDLDPRWNRAVLRCLRTEPEDRFGSTNEIAAFLTYQSVEHQRGIQLNETVIPQSYWKDHSPFRSLQVFEPEDAWLFFGRDLETAELMSCLSLAPMAAVVGNSGSGKSSLIRAGLIPALRRGHFQYEGSPVHSWRVAIVRPSAFPFDYLAESLPGQLAPELTPTQQLEFIAARRAQLPSGGDGLRNVISALVGAAGKRAESEHVLLVVDQFEELFTLVRDRETRQKYIDVLLAACRLGSVVPVHLVIALRADFYTNCLEHANLSRSLALNLYNVPRMNSEQLGDCIRKRLALAGASAEPGLAEALLADVGDEPGDLALLEHALGQLWEKQSGAARILTNRAYAEIGRLRGALSQHADEVYGRLTNREQQVVQRIFLELVHLGEGAEDTRRRVEKQVLLDLGASEQVGPLLAELASSRLIATGAIGEQTFIEVSHEALIRAWPRLREWLNQNREDLRLKRRLRERAEEWQKLSRDPGALLQGLRLSEAEDWLRKQLQTPDALREFIQASGAARAEAVRKECETQERTRRSAIRFRWLSYSLAGLLLAIGLLGIIAQREKRSADAALARTDVQDGIKLMEAGHPNQAAAYFARALRSAPDSLAAISWLSDFLINQYRHSAGALLQHQGPVYYAAFSPDGRRVVTASRDSTAQVWDTETGRALGVPLQHQGAVYSAAFSPDGRRVATASDDKTARVWDAETGKAAGIPLQHQGAVYSAAFSPDGRRVVTASLDLTARVWDAETGKLMGVSLQHEGSVLSAAFSPDGRRVVTASDDKTARVWDAESGKPVGAPLQHQGRVSFARFSPDGRRVVTASDDKTARVWDADTGKPVGVPLEHQGPVYYATFSPDGRRVVTASNDGTARVWDADTGRSVGAPMPSWGPVYWVGYSPDGRRVVTASYDRTARVWDTETREVVDTLQHQGPVYSATFSSDGRHVITASNDGTARVSPVLLICCASQQDAYRLASLAEAVSGNELNDQGSLSTINSQERLQQLSRQCGTGPAAEMSLDWIVRRYVAAKMNH